MLTSWIPASKNLYHFEVFLEKKKYLLDAVESTEVDNLLLEVSETLKLSVDAKGANNLCLLEMLVFVAASASSFDLTFSKMLLKRPRLTSAVVSLRDFLG